MTDTFGTLRAGQSAARAAVAPVLTVIEPEAFAPLGRLGEWLFASGARLTMVRPWQGDPVPDLTEIGDGLVVLGGAMSAHDDDAHPWLADLRPGLYDVDTSTGFTLLDTGGTARVWEITACDVWVVE